MFSTYNPHFLEKGYPKRIVIMGKFFEVEIFIFKYVLDYSESIPIKKNQPKIFFFAIFLTYEANLQENGYVPRGKS